MVSGRHTPSDAWGLAVQAGGCICARHRIALDSQGFMLAFGVYDTIDCHFCCHSRLCSCEHALLHMAGLKVKGGSWALWFHDGGF